MFRKTGLAAFAILLTWTSAAFAQTTYWLPTITSTPTEKTYSFQTQVPEFMVPWVTARTPMGGGAETTETINGTPYALVEQHFAWDPNGANPRDGRIAVMSAKNAVAGSDFRSDPQLANSPQVIAALDALAKPYGQTWKSADVRVLRQNGQPNPNLQLVVPISESDQAKARMRQLGESTTRGKFFPSEVEIPVDLEAMRREIILWGNIERRDPTFRKDNKWANNFSGDSVMTAPGKSEKLFKTNPQPPYFNDLVLHPKLNEACQYMAEYYAKTNGNASQPPGGPKHDAPGAVYEGASMFKLGDRLKHFANGVGSSGEGLAGPGGADMAPETWMRTETHYRPWFNIGHDTVSIGLGAAKTDKGWYFCKIGGTDLPDGVSAATAGGNPLLAALGQPKAEEPAAPANPLQALLQPKPQNPAPAAVPAANPLQQALNSGSNDSTGSGNTPVTSAVGTGTIFDPNAASARPASDPDVTVAAGTTLERGRKYMSPNGQHYLALQGDGNLVIKRAADDGFVWGLNLVIPTQLHQVAEVAMQSSGTLSVKDAQGTSLWGMPGPDPLLTGFQERPNSHLELTDSGELNIRAPDGTVTWSTVPKGSFPMAAGGTMQRGVRFLSPDETFYAELQSDGNLVVKRTADRGFVWGLNLVPGVDFQQIAKLDMTPGGQIVATNADGSYVIWAEPIGSAMEGSQLELSNEGKLQIKGPNGSVTWQSH